MITRILHVSDLHFGSGDNPDLEEALVRLIERVDPELVIASGDLTHRGQRDQHERVAAFLRRLGRSVLAVPGNHDIPYTFPARFTSPWREFEREWETTEPVFSSAEAHVVGLNSVRPWRHQSGGVSTAQLERATTRLRAGQPGRAARRRAPPPDDRRAVAHARRSRSRAATTSSPCWSTRAPS